VPLPIDPFIPEIVRRLDDDGALVITAPPGTGKTTRVAPALIAAGPVLLLQPRRVAARTLARRIVEERGFRLGEEVGWQIRFERRFGPRTRLLVVTEGILTARLAADPMLADFRTVVFDEAHERSLNTDLGLALVAEARRARADLRIVVMSATIDATPFQAFLGGCSLVTVAASTFPVDVQYAPELPVAAAVARAARGDAGHVLCFLPGAPEIRRLGAELGAVHGEIIPLHGSLTPVEQERALAASRARKIVLATNVAETSLTVEGVTEVIDTGLVKVARYDPATAIDRLEVERVSRDSADQRAGRAGRIAPGRATRLWDERARLRPGREPDIARVDLTGPVLDVLAWGGDPRSFRWFEAPPAAAIDAALELLERLGALHDGRLTALGSNMRRLPLPPRLAAVLVRAGGGREAAAACAILAERDFLRQDVAETTDSDVASRVDRLRQAPRSVRDAARDLCAVARRVLGDGAPGEPLERALLAAFPDRVARRREPGSDRLLLASGTGARLTRSSGVRNAQLLVALDVRSGRRGPGAEATVSLASAIEAAWLEPDRIERRHRWDRAAGSVRAVERRLYGACVLDERPVVPDPIEAERLLRSALIEAGPGRDDARLLRRARLAGLAFDWAALVERATVGRAAVADVDVAGALTHDERRALARAAPEALTVPSGRRVRLDYRDGGDIVLSVKLQELFGLATTPRVGGAPVLVELLAPSGRPVQTTRDLASFWRTTYAEVRRELRGRYPKHPWPEDPTTAPATARTTRRKGG